MALGCVLVAAQTAAPPGAKALADLQRRVNDGQFSAAYELANTMPESQGDPHFDFLYGVAAINMGRAAEAVLALQRHLAFVPGNDRARLDLARAYFELGDYVRARQEFEFVLRYNPPAEVRATIQQYLDSMQTRESLLGRANSRLYVETGYGHDDNANIGTYNDWLSPGLQIDATSKALPSDYAWLAAGGKWVRQVSAPFSIYAGADFDNKLNKDAAKFDVSNVSAYAGFALVSGAMVYRLTVADALMSVNRSRYRGSLSTSGEVQYAAGDGLTFSGSLQVAEQSYTNENAYRDSTMETLGVGVHKAFPTAWRPTVGLQISVANEDNLNKRPDLSQVVNTWRLSLGASPLEKLGVSLAYAEQRGNYQAVDAGFGSVRDDLLSTVDLVVSYSLNHNWVLRADVQLAESKSNQALFAYRRTLGGIKLRYSF